MVYTKFLLFFLLLDTYFLPDVVDHLYIPLDLLFAVLHILLNTLDELLIQFLQVKRLNHR